MNGWFRDKETYECYDGSRSITIYKLDGKYDKNPHSPARRQEVLDEMVSTAMVSLVHLYRNSVGGLIDAEARRLLNEEFEDLEDKRWKWMFARSDQISGDTAGAISFSDTGALARGTPATGVSTSLTAARTGLAGSSRYLLFEQVPVNDGETSTKLIPSYRQEKSKYACHIYAYSDLRDFNAEGGRAPPMSSDPRSNISIPGIDTSINLSAIGDSAPLSYDPFHRIDFGVTQTGINDSIITGSSRKCMYQLVAGTPLNGLLERTGDEGFKERETRINAIKSVSEPIPGDGPFNAKRSRKLGSAGVYDGLGRPSSAWFSRARFKAFMESVNKKRRVDPAEPEYDLRDVNGYIADTLNRREEIAVMYPREERVRDACEIVNLAASCIVGEATDDWFVETDPLNGMSFENRLRLVLPPRKLVGTERDNAKEKASAYYCHCYVSDADDFAHLFPKRNPPPNPGHNAEARHAHLARLATAGIRRSKRAAPNLVPQRPFERRVYTRTEDENSGICVLGHALYEGSDVPAVVQPKQAVDYVGCGFSESVVEPLCRGGVEAADGLVDAVSDFVTMFKDTESEFADHASKEFKENAFSTEESEFVLVPADPESLPCGEICIDDNEYWMVGSTPTALSCAAKLAMTYVTSKGKLERNVPQTVEEEDMMHARVAIEKLASNARYTSDYDASKHSANALTQGVMRASAGESLSSDNLSSLKTGALIGGAGLAASAMLYAIQSNIEYYNSLKSDVDTISDAVEKQNKTAELENSEWLPKTPEEYYSRLYAAVLWVMMGKNNNPEKKAMFEVLLRCADPNRLINVATENASIDNLINEGVEIESRPGIVSQIFSMGSSWAMSNPLTIAGWVAKGALGITAVGGIGIAGKMAYDVFSKTYADNKQAGKDFVMKRFNALSIVGQNVLNEFNEENPTLLKDTFDFVVESIGLTGNTAEERRRLAFQRANLTPIIEKLKQDILTVKKELKAEEKNKTKIGINISKCKTKKGSVIKKKGMPAQFAKLQKELKISEYKIQDLKTKIQSMKVEKATLKLRNDDDVQAENNREIIDQDIDVREYADNEYQNRALENASNGEWTSVAINIGKSFMSDPRWERERTTLSNHMTKVLEKTIGLSAN